MKLIALLVLCCLISACQPAENSAADYVSRLQNVLDTSVKVSEIKAPEFPQPRDLQLKLEPSELSIREFLSLRECQLHTTIARRNSLIGKVANQSQLLFSDIRMLAQGPACLDALGDSSLAKKLESFLEKKLSEIDQSLWLGLLAQDEHAKFWSIGGGQPNLESTIALEALSSFAMSVRNGKFDFTDQQFNQIERHLGKLRFANTGLLLLRYTQLLNAMSHANSLVRQRLDKPLCLNGKPTAKAHHLSNVVNKYFINRVQRDAVTLNSLNDAIMSSHKKLEKPLIATSNAPYREWAKQRDDLLELGKSATTTHAKLLQKLYQQCGLEVGTPHSAKEK